MLLFGAPTACSAWDGTGTAPALDFEGRCLTEACSPLASDSLQPFLEKPSECTGTGEYCTPCFRPVTGVSTGACELGDDAPVETGDDNKYADCCLVETDPADYYMGSCIPNAFLTQDEMDVTPDDGLCPAEFSNRNLRFREILSVRNRKFQYESPLHVISHQSSIKCVPFGRTKNISRERMATWYQSQCRGLSI